MARKCRAGQLIAHMGEGAPNKPVLYFEIRRNGKPVDPLRFLSREVNSILHDNYIE